MTETHEWEAVFWDIGGVILELESVQEAHRAFVQTLLEERGLGGDLDEAVATWRTIVGEHFREREGTEFRAAREGYAKAVRELVDEDVSTDEWRPRFEAAVDAHVRPVPGAVETIRTLADWELHQGVISDVDDEQGRRLLGIFDVRDCFDTITTSEAVGRTKPDPAMFETAIEAAGVDPARSLMIGDRYEHDVAGASTAGLRSVAFGAEDGPAVDYRIDSPRDVFEIVDGERG